MIAVSLFLLVAIAVSIPLVSLLREFPGRGAFADWLTAREIYQQAMALRGEYKTDRAIDRFNEAIGLYAFDPRFHVGLGLAYLDKDNLRDAEAEFSQAVRLGPECLDGWVNLSGVRLDRGEVQGAHDAAEKAMALRSRDPAVLAVMSLVWAAEGRIDAAEKVFNQATTIGSESPRFWFMAGKYHRSRGALQRAEADLRQAVSMSPKNPEFLEWLSLVLYRQRKYEESEKLMKQALEINPNSPVNWHNLGTLFLTQKRLDKAADALARATALDPHTAVYWKDLGQSLFLAGKYVEAEEPLRRLTELDPRSGPGWGLYVADLRKQKKYQLAELAMKSFIDAGHQNSFLLWMYLAGLLEESGRSDEAKEAYKNALELEPPDQVRALIQAKLSGNAGLRETAKTSVDPAESSARGTRSKTSVQSPGATGAKQKSLTPESSKVR